MPQCLALVDCNNFYVSCERVFRPDLLGKPVAVLSNNDGCIVARSQEVKALGIKMGAPVFQVQNLIN
jgi:DNA polymerase V